MPTPHARLYVTDATDFHDGMPITCSGVTGTPGANVAEDGNTTTGTDGTGLYIDLTNVFLGPSDVTGTGACNYIGLEFSSVGHVTASNGVEVKGGSPSDPTQTLVGMVYAGGSHSVSDSQSARNVASWFNRKTKTCKNNYTADRTLTSTTYLEVNSEIQCKFVTWGENDLAWRINGMVSTSAASNVVQITAGFDSTTVGESEEIGTVVSAVTQKPVLTVTGAKTGLTEGAHYVTVLGKQLTSGTLKLYGTNPITSLEVSIPQ